MTSASALLDGPSVLDPVNAAAAVVTVGLLWGFCRALWGPAPQKPVTLGQLLAANAIGAGGFYAALVGVYYAPAPGRVAVAGIYGACLLAWVWLLRGPKPDFGSSDGGGFGDGPGDDDRPSGPPGPGGEGLDWDAFERDFWAHVDRERAVALV